MENTIDELVNFYKIMRINNNHHILMLDYIESEGLCVMDRHAFDYDELFVIADDEIIRVNIEGIIKLHNDVEEYLKSHENSLNLLLDLITVTNSPLGFKQTYYLPKNIPDVISTFESLNKLNQLSKIAKETQENLTNS